ncbi:VacJ family lipoprotein, partial [Rhodobaculum claviforme]
REPPRRAPLVLVLAAVPALALAACTPAPPGVDIWDPQEAQNREAHAINRRLDAAVPGGAGGDGVGVPRPVARGVANFAANAGQPSNILNSVLQGRPDPAIRNTLRFMLNTTVGIGGLFDVAGALGIEGRWTDFGETLHVWGLPEGAYQELPVIGPSTERDSVGFVVDLLIDPLNALRPPGTRNRVLAARHGSRALALLGERADYSEALDALIGQSADSYVQTRLLYLQSRRFRLDGTAALEQDVFDPYDDLYDD